MSVDRRVQFREQLLSQASDFDGLRRHVEDRLLAPGEQRFDESVAAKAGPILDQSEAPQRRVLEQLFEQRGGGGALLGESIAVDRDFLRDPGDRGGRIGSSWTGLFSIREAPNLRRLRTTVAAAGNQVSDHGASGSRRSLPGTEAK
ncbi:MAG: hypothetical protein U0X73_00790 [Thermoanaerobaculia bacterium]